MNRVKIAGRIFMYHEKEPYVTSGESILGAIEFDDLKDVVKCHECGEWFKHLGSHVFRAHGILANDYKIKHGLSIRAALVSEETRIKEIKAAKKRHAEGIYVGHVKSGKRAKYVKRAGHVSMETRNLRSECHAQIIKRLNALSLELGHSPTAAESRKAGLSASTVCFILNTNWQGALQISGLPRSKPGGHVPISNESLLLMLREFWISHHRLPSGSDIRRGLAPNLQTLKRHFGSAVAAYVKAEIIEPKDLPNRSKRFYARFVARTALNSVTCGIPSADSPNPLP